MRRHAGGMPLLTDLSLSMSTDQRSHGVRDSDIRSGSYVYVP